MLFTLLAVSFYVSAASAQKASDAAPTSIEWTVQIDPLTTALGIAHVLFEKDSPLGLQLRLDRV